MCEGEERCVKGGEVCEGEERYEGEESGGEGSERGRDGRSMKVRRE